MYSATPPENMTPSIWPTAPSGSVSWRSRRSSGRGTATTASITASAIAAATRSRSEDVTVSPGVQVSPARLAWSRPAGLVGDHESATHVECGRRHDPAVIDDRVLGRTAPDVDVEDAGPPVVRLS